MNFQAILQVFSKISSSSAFLSSWDRNLVNPATWNITLISKSMPWIHKIWGNYRTLHYTDIKVSSIYFQFWIALRFAVRIWIRGRVSDLNFSIYLDPIEYRNFNLFPCPILTRSIQMSGAQNSNRLSDFASF